MGSNPTTLTMGVSAVLGSNPIQSSAGEAPRRNGPLAQVEEHWLETPGASVRLR